MIAMTRQAILVVDDYMDARHSTSDALEEHGYHVLEAANGQEALSILVRGDLHAVRLILLDLQMPFMNGWQLLNALGASDRLHRIPVIIASAHPARLETIKHGSVIGFLQTPYHLPELLTLVDACLRH
jgi:two-component system, chemotaxis family, sensor histidine kinase and response regulator PixL